MAETLMHLHDVGELLVPVPGIEGLPEHLVLNVVLLPHIWHQLDDGVTSHAGCHLDFSAKQSDLLAFLIVSWDRRQGRSGWSTTSRVKLMSLLPMLQGRVYVPVDCLLVQPPNLNTLVLSSLLIMLWANLLILL